MRALFATTAWIAACSPHGGTGPGWPPCGERQGITSAEDSPFGESPAATLRREGTFEALVTWQDPTAALPSRWTHTPGGDPQLHRAGGEPGCADDVELDASGWLGAADSEAIPSTFGVRWATPDAEPQRYVGAVIDVHVAEGPTFDWLADVLSQAGDPFPPPYAVKLVIRDDEASLIVAPSTPSEGELELAGLPRLSGAAEIRPL